MISIGENEVPFKFFHETLCSSDLYCNNFGSCWWSEGGKYSTGIWSKFWFWDKFVECIHEGTLCLPFMIRACTHTWEYKNDLIHSSLLFFSILFFSQEFISSVLQIHVSYRNLVMQEWNLCKTSDFSADTFDTSFQLNHISKPKLSLYHEFQSWRESYISNQCCKKYVPRTPFLMFEWMMDFNLSVHLAHLSCMNIVSKFIKTMTYLFKIIRYYMGPCFC